MMTKRVLSLVLAAVMALMLMPAVHADTVMYVSPATGTTVNLRSTPEIRNDNLIAQIPYGTALTVKYVTNGWAVIDYRQGRYNEAYMMVKYMTNNYVPPTANNASRNGTNTDEVNAANEELANQYRAMNTQFKSFRLVSKSFTVYGKPSRASGWSNLRFAPNEKAQLIRQVRMNDPLTVIGETDRWYQVQDPVTGFIGYISRFYVSTTMN